MNARTRTLLRAFPLMRANSGDLEDIACPKCGNRTLFHIAVQTVVELTDNGTGDCVGDMEYDDLNIITCPICDHSDKLRKFTFHGLEAGLERLSQFREMLS